jgi:hypothetical protein
MISNAFKNRRHLSYRDYKAKIACGRLSKRDDIYALSVDLHFELIDSIVIFKYLTRDLAVALTQCEHGAFKRLLSLAAQEQNPVA